MSYKRKMQPVPEGTDAPSAKGPRMLVFLKPSIKTRIEAVFAARVFAYQKGPQGALKEEQERIYRSKGIQAVNVWYAAQQPSLHVLYNEILEAGLAAVENKI